MKNLLVPNWTPSPGVCLCVTDWRVAKGRHHTPLRLGGWRPDASVSAECPRKYPHSSQRPCYRQSQESCIWQRSYASAGMFIFIHL